MDKPEKVKYEIEFPITVSPQLLYQYISTSSGLSEWFADNVNSRGEIFTFIWDTENLKAKMSTKKSSEKVRFRWLDEDGNDSDYYFEFRIQEDELTKDVRSEEHTSELQSRPHLVCRLLLEKKNNK